MHSAQPTGGQRQNERPACTNSDPIVHDVSLSSTGSALSVLQRRAHEELQQGGVSRTAQKATSKKKGKKKCNECRDEDPDPVGPIDFWPAGTRSESGTFSQRIRIQIQILPVTIEKF